MRVRSGSLATTMSSYLIAEIDAAPNIDVRYNACVVGARGRGQLDGLTIADAATGGATEVDAAALFVLIGGEPRTAGRRPRSSATSWVSS